MAPDRQATWAQRWGNLCAPILTALGIVFGIIWWAATLTASVNDLKQDMSEVKTALGIAKGAPDSKDAKALPLVHIIARTP